MISLQAILPLILVIGLTSAGSIQDLRNSFVYGAKQVNICSDLLQGNVSASSANATKTKTVEYFENNVAALQKIIDDILKTVDDESNGDRLFEEFKTLYHKVYPSRAFESYSKEVLLERVKLVLENNLKAIYGQSSYVLSLNSRSDKPLSVILDQTPAGYWPNVTSKELSYANSYLYDSLRSAHAHQETSVINEGGCRASVHFAAAATVESYLAQKGHSLTQQLSTQQLNDCARVDSKEACGATFASTLEYIKSHGLTSLQNYPYRSKEAEPCDRTKESQAVARIEAWHSVLPHNDETVLKMTLEKYGPLAVMIHFSDALAHYKQGIFNGDCKGERNHAVLLVGYGRDTATKQDYWILKNQWGGNYGEHGYFRLKRSGGNQCDVAGDAVYVV